MKRVVVCSLAVLVMVARGEAQRTALDAEIAGVYGQSELLYRDLHQHPELSMHEQNTAATLAAALRASGYDVTTGVGKTGVVGVLKNGDGPVVMLRTELDALPVEEMTGLPFASRARAKDDNGVDVAVMHACGHDLHMAAWVGTARVMAAAKSRWRGTLVMVGQPGEEGAGGAAAMIADGFFNRFPRPAFAIAVHDDARSPAGVVGYHAGPVMTNYDTVHITLIGRGGHGARPESTVDPVVLAARVITALQTIVSRETSPFDPAVVTVGSIHGGTRANIIPDEVKLELSVRSLTDQTRARLFSAIERIVNAEAAAAGAPKPPVITRESPANALVNDTSLTSRVAAALVRELGREQVKDTPPEMVSEDFSEFARGGVPALMLRIGAVEPSRLVEAARTRAELPSLHSSQFAPQLEPTLKAAIAAEVVALRELMPVK